MIMVNFEVKHLYYLLVLIMDVKETNSQINNTFTKNYNSCFHVVGVKVHRMKVRAK